MFTFSFGQTKISTLWEKVREAEEQDLPKTEQKLLREIAQVAEAEGDYAQLLKAELREARSLCSVSPDSLEPAVERLKVREQEAKDSVLRAVYCTVLGYVYKTNSQLDEDLHEQIADEYYSRALEHPHLLAATKTKVYETIIDKGSDSRLFDDDLLSVIGYEAGRFDVLRDYYASSGNRTAELLSALQLLKQQRTNEMESLDSSPYLQSLDSLIARFADLEICGEAAIERYNFMKRQTRATAEQKIAYIDEALSRWGRWKRMSTLLNERRELIALQYHAGMEEKVITTGQWTDISLSAMRGIDSLTMRVYSVKTDGIFPYDPDSRYGYEDHVKKLLTPQPALTQTMAFEKHKEYEMFDSILRLPPLPVGVYMLEFESSPATRTSRKIIFVSNVRVISQPMPERKIRFVAVDAVTGQPLAGAKLKITSNTGYYSDQKTYEAATDAKGEYIYTRGEKERDCDVFATYGDDKYCPSTREGGSFSFYEGSAENYSGSVYTDRQMYRPGQTVHAAVILYRRFETLKHAVDAGVKVTLELHDANDKTVATKEVTTDDYGTCAADFRLPSSGLAGVYTVKAVCKRGNNKYDSTYSDSFRVEEYKRPTFEVEMPRVETAYADGDTVSVTGTARTYSGVKVQGAKVKYKVTRKRAYWWFSYYSYWNQMVIGRDSDDQVLAEGETVTGDDGTFTVPVPIVVPKTRYTMFYNFVVTADVTDQAGETHAGSVSLPMGNKPLAFSADLPEKMLLEEGGTLSFALRNASGNELTEKVRYRFDGGKWLTASTDDEVEIPAMASGRHTLDAVCRGETLQQTFTVFSLDDTTPAEETDDWFYVSHSQFPRDGKPVTLQVGASDPDLHIVYAIYAGKKVIDSGSRDMSNALINLKLTYEEEYGNGLLLTYAWVKNGKVHTHNATISRPLPDTRLRLQWATFRDRLTPGQQEEWTLSVVRPDGTPADAQLMATLYDKSLDQIEAHSWSLSPSLSLSTPFTRWNHAYWESVGWNGYLRPVTDAVPSLDFSTFDHNLYPARWVPLRFHRRARMNGRGKGALMVEEEPMMLAKAIESNAAYDTADALAEVAIGSVEEAETEEDAGGGEQAQEQVRTNLDETAFFMPQLTTDSTGHVALRFTLPESLTTWRFMGAAHTKDMFCGMIDGEAIARKEVMVQPNMPRFLRHGDRAVIATRIFNTSDHEVSGTARLLLLDPEDEHVVYKQKQDVAVKADGTATASFEVDCTQLPTSVSLLIARISYTAEAVGHASQRDEVVSFSDGEQHYLPLLPDMEHVTRTLPITLHKPGTLNIDLKALVPDGVRDSRFTLEYTNNPAWLMIQALPAIGHPHDDCAICQAASLYANTIGMNIIAQNPNAKEVFEQWEKEESTETSLMSNLAKNQELQDLILDETPWVADADREQEQKERLADFFDADMMNQRLDNALEKLKKLQKRDGSWSWWPDMRGSWYMTVSISQMLVRMNTMTSTQLPNSSTPQLLEKAFKFMGNEIIDIVKEMKRMEKEGYEMVFPSQTALDWLYICAVDGRDLPRKVREANDYLLNLLKKEKKVQSIYGKAMSAIVFSATEPKLAKQYAKSLKEYTVYREDMGRYYDTPRALYSWRDYRIPTQVISIEALQRLTPNDTETIDEMLRWLLQEKRTQAWDTPLSTIDAIYAFLNGCPQVLAPQEGSTFTLDGKDLQTPKATAGLGYVKTNLPQPASLTIDKTSTGTSWGAVYAQFMQTATEIDSQASGIKVTREVLPSPSSILPSPSTLHPSPNTLKVGDRVIVRITITADRDYDFVEVIDKRASCLEPVNQKSGYHWGRGSYYEGYYCTPRDCTTNYYFDRLAKGKHTIETEYYVDRPGRYDTGTCTASCAYSPEFRGNASAITISVE